MRFCRKTVFKLPLLPICKPITTTCKPITARARARRKRTGRNKSATNFAAKCAPICCAICKRRALPNDRQPEKQYEAAMLHRFQAASYKKPKQKQPENVSNIVFRLPFAAQRNHPRRTDHIRRLNLTAAGISPQAPPPQGSIRLAPPLQTRSRRNYAPCCPLSHNHAPPVAQTKPYWMNTILRAG